MGKTRAGKKRGIQRGVGKHKIKSKNLEGEPRRGRDQAEQFFLGLSQSTYFQLGRKSFDIMLWGCEKFRFIPITRLRNGTFVYMDLKNRLIHYTCLSLYIIMTMHKLRETVNAVLTHHLQIETFMCLSVLLVLLVPICISAGVVLRPNETMDLMNSWPCILSCLRELDVIELSPFDDLSTSLKGIVVLVVTQGIGLTCVVVGFGFPSMSTLWLNSCENWGIIPEGLLPRLVWQILLIPLEYVTYNPQMFVSAFSGCILLISWGVLRICTEEIRKVKISDLESREKVERLYVCVELFNRTFDVWIRFMIAPTIIGVSLAIIVGTFISIRYTELPIFIYLIFPFQAAALMIIIFWASYDAVRIVRDAEDILGRLWSYESRYMRGMTKAERTQLMKRAKAMKVLEFPMGGFADFSLNVPINIWEENLNQVLFLLSL